MSDPSSRRARWLPPALWAAALLTATSWPNPDVPDVGEGDKVVHALLYGVLAWLIGRAEPSLTATWRRALLVVAALACFAVLDEWHQKWVPGRSADPADAAADVVGAAGGLAIAAARRRAA